MMSHTSKRTFYQVDFEVFGRVQGVFFRKYTKKNCDKHQVTGWVINTQHGTVQGTLEGGHQNIIDVKCWLATKGSPSSRIEKAEFFNERQTENKSYDTFKIIRNPIEVEKKAFKR